MGGEGESEDYGNALLFICVAMLFVVGVYELKKVFRMPASLLLVLSGLFLRYVATDIGGLDGAVGIWYKVDQWSTLLFFLPALIFECGFSVDWYAFKRELPQIMLMATTAVVLHTFLTTIALKHILVFDLDWNEAFLIGTLLSATDHVTVVSQIKEMKVGKKFETLIQGETLLIDGSVMVLFFVLLKRVTGEHFEDNETALHFFRLVFGGLALGLAFSLAFFLAIRRIINDEVAEVNLTMLTTYLIFFTAEDSGIEFSGAIATVTFGLFMAAYGKTLISPVVEHSLHIFWKIISKNIEGIIFILSGMMIGEISLADTKISEIEVWKTVVLFIFLHIIRGIVVLIHYPLLSRLGLGLDWKEAVLLTVAGAKGVISSSLAILVWHNDEIGKDFRDLALFIVIICSSLSILLDSIFVWLTMKYLGLGEISEAEEHSFLQVTQSIVEANEQIMARLSKRYKMVNWESAENFAGTKHLVSKVISQTTKGKKLIKSESGMIMNQTELIEVYFRSIDFNEEELLVEARRRCLMAMKGLYWEHFQNGLVLGSNALKLIESTDYCLEMLQEPVKDWEFLRKKAFQSVLMKALSRLTKYRLMQAIFGNLHFRYLADSYDISSAFIAIHEEAIETMEQMLKQIEPKIVKQIVGEFEYQLHLAKEYKKHYISNDFSEVVSYMQTKQASYSMLNQQRRLLNEYFEKGLIDTHEHGMLVETIDKNFWKLKSVHKPNLPKFSDLLMSSAVMEGLADHEKEALIQLCTKVSFNEEETIFDENSQVDGLYIILKGKVEEAHAKWTYTFSAGEAVGDLNLLPNVEKSPTSAIALTTVLAALLPRSSKALSYLSLGSLEMLAIKLLACTVEQFDVSQSKLRLRDFIKIAQLSKIQRYPTGDTLYLSSGGFLIYGKLQGQTHSQIYFPSDNVTNTVLEDAAFMHFDTSLKLALIMHEGKFKKAIRSLKTTVRKATSSKELKSSPNEKGTIIDISDTDN